MTVARSHAGVPAAQPPSGPADPDTRLDRLRTMLVDRAAVRCAESGYRRIVLWGGGDNARRYIRQPWRWRGVDAVGVVSSNGLTSIDGVTVVALGEIDRLGSLGANAVVLLPDHNEPAAFAEAQAAIDGRLPIVRVFEPVAASPAMEPPAIEARLVEQGLEPADARWIATNRAERHDASVESLPPERTEMHLRRYWLAEPLARHRHVIDAACGTGYGSALLGRSARSVLGVDIDPDSVAYATRRFAAPSVRFECNDVTRLAACDGSIGLLTSFETIEHVREPAELITECARVLRPGGALVLSTPNDRGLTDFHEHSLTLTDLETLLSDGFAIDRRLGQIPGNDPVSADLPPGIFELAAGAPEPETLLVMASRL